jgi:phosphoadenosine phosphosulfate reductase
VGATGASQKKAAGPLYKLAPLADWSDADVENYTRAHNVPRHPLYAQSYRSIGCAPCTRAVAAGEDARAGRWWWETDVEKECGLHIRADGRVVPAFDVALEKIITAGQPPSRGEQFGMSP